MSKFIPIVAGITGTLTVSAVGGYLLSTQNTTIVRNKFKDAIIDLDRENDLITKKLTKLKDASTRPTNLKLKSAQTKEKVSSNSGLNEFKEGCKEIYDSVFEKKESELFKDFQNYCAKTNKDKIGEGEWATTGAQWNNRFAKLNQDNTKPISPSLIAVSKKESNNGDSLKRWCDEKADAVFEGDENKEFKDVKSFCGKTD
ncbi:hypothetical protein A6V39_05230 [Candidatus Mycoplasma haematobovis]|uniref:Uncharacterized protein n=1 Tax=Candidatus Mycoplasma haematobovis TaxID=432608 RepID=A0A1A9QCU3_9MOLU|nr:hypothetical protein [Candidatus Mycoplasma haematobovis]OAL09831.1 hypothetical protein A6V39_05230 [Candidatus Mycoplasma haematobovis]